jgi:hypothetical protein
MLDLNDAEPQISTDLIPDGSFVKVLLNLRPGGVDGMTSIDARLLKKSAQPGSDVLLLDCEFTVIEGPHAKRKFWQAFTVYGGKLDDKGQSLGWQISKRTIRGIIESAFGIDPKDESPDARARRSLPGLKALDGLVFVAKIRIETQRDGQGEQNRLDIAVTPDQPEWAKVMKGEVVPPRPGARRAAKANGATQLQARLFGRARAEPRRPAPLRRTGSLSTRRLSLRLPRRIGNPSACLAAGSRPSNGPVPPGSTTSRCRRANGDGTAVPPHRRPRLGWRRCSTR